MDCKRLDCGNITIKGKPETAENFKSGLLEELQAQGRATIKNKTEASNKQQPNLQRINLAKFQAKKYADYGTLALPHSADRHLNNCGKNALWIMAEQFTSKKNKPKCFGKAISWYSHKAHTENHLRKFFLTQEELILLDGIRAKRNLNPKRQEQYFRARYNADNKKQRKLYEVMLKAFGKEYIKHTEKAKGKDKDNETSQYIKAKIKETISRMATAEIARRYQDNLMLYQDGSRIEVFG